MRNRRKAMKDPLVEAVRRAIKAGGEWECANPVTYLAGSCDTSNGIVLQLLRGASCSQDRKGRRLLGERVKVDGQGYYFELIRRDGHTIGGIRIISPA